MAYFDIIDQSLFFSATLLALTLVCSGLCVKQRWFKARTLPYPPGPRPLPLIGNLLDVPKEFAWIQWAKHKELYGPISHVEVLGRHIFLLNEYNVAVDLMEKRSNIYSDRPHLVFCGDMVGWKDSLPLARQDATFRTLRKNLHQVIGTKAHISVFHPILTREARKLASRLRSLVLKVDIEDMGKRMHEEIRITVGAIILSLSFGYTIKVDPTGQTLDPLVKLAEEGLRIFSLAAASGKWLVDLVPILQYIPSWPYEPAFKRTAREWRKLTREVLEVPYAFVKNSMATGEFSSSVISALLQDSPTPEEEEIIKWTANALYAGGSDTSVVTIHAFLLAMTLFPDVQRKAQEEIDTIIGNDRLPAVEDRASLPYVDALVMEVLRWAPIVPMAFPHVATEEGSYRGYYIPKGSILLANTWLYTRDLANYHDPEEFKPERYLGDNPEKDPRGIVFGYGRRICPGRELADSVVFIAIATILATCSISKARDAHGEAIEPKIEYCDGVLSELRDFPCRVTPRPGSEKLFEVIGAEEDISRKQSIKHLSGDDCETIVKIMESRK